MKREIYVGTVFKQGAELRARLEDGRVLHVHFLLVERLKLQPDDRLQGQAQIHAKPDSHGRDGFFLVETVSKLKDVVNAS